MATVDTDSAVAITTDTESEAGRARLVAITQVAATVVVHARLAAITRLAVFTALAVAT
jgi:hypothetical protein